METTSLRTKEPYDKLYTQKKELQATLSTLARLGGLDISSDFLFTEIEILDDLVSQLNKLVKKIECSLEEN